MKPLHLTAVILAAGILGGAVAGVMIGGLPTWLPAWLRPGLTEAQEIADCELLHRHWIGGTKGYLETMAPVDNRFQWPHLVTVVDTVSMTGAVCKFYRDGTATAVIEGHLIDKGEAAAVLGR